MTTHPRTVTRDEWLVARKAFLAREKAFDRERDALAAARRDLPRVKLDKPYTFRGRCGDRTLLELFEGRPQLIVYHFMLGPDKTAGCASCSFVTDNIALAWPHFAARNTAFTLVSRAELPVLEAFKKRMGWTIPWMSSAGSDFNFDFGVSFATDEDAQQYNYGGGRHKAGECPGISCFSREGDDVFHTYSTYERGIDLMCAAYSYLDLTPLGRQEADLDWPMQWIKHRDRYER